MAGHEEEGSLTGSFVRRDGAGGTLWVRRDLESAALAAFLDRESGWESRLDRRAGGRGPTGLLDFGAAGPVARLKRLRRGGIAGPLWRDRFPGSSRILANLAVPAEARRRGVPTPEPLALLAIPGPPGLWRGWLATEEIPGAYPLERRFGSTEEAAAVREAMRVVRAMHDAGVEHRDLNLGNLLLRPVAEGEAVVVLDLDDARLHPGPLRFGVRRRALRRLERSTAKRTGVRAYDAWYVAYADGDAALAERLAAGRWLDRMWISLHRLGWKEGR